ncbi:MAG TPA: chromosomal replication initiator DnaA [Allosphingosinicella sp.]|uniref:chromosomal replication initiator DnaA n=1 Tax=Allosphingosinicella sp. TaxID=2823234 RepID=UPI002F2ABFB3
MNQIALPLDWPVADGNGDFLIGEPNRLAFEHLKRWSLWPVPVSLLTGPRKSGRSLLGRIFVRKTGGRLFDDAERHDEERLFHAWNEAQAMRRPLLLIAHQVPPAWDIKLPDLRSRITATPQIRIDDPDDILLAQLITKLLGDRGLVVSPDVTEFLVPRIERSYLAVQQVVDVIDRAMLSSRGKMGLATVRRTLTEAGLIRTAKQRA